MDGARNTVECMAMLFDEGRIEESLDCFAPDAIFTNPLGTMTGRDEIAGMFQMFAAAFTGISHNIAHAIVAGELEATEGRITCTHTGILSSPAGDIPATGRSLDLAQALWGTVRHGKIVELRAYWDLAAFMAQLGLAPEPAAATD
jgi:predicted ester cyclase